MDLTGMTRFMKMRFLIPIDFTKGKGKHSNTGGGKPPPTSHHFKYYANKIIM